jgi:uncharacterized membrane protein YphA (DoxX/SURF4 family)
MSNTPGTTVSKSFLRNPTRQAYQLLRWGFAVLAVVAGLDKFVYYLTDWQQFLNPDLFRLIPLEPRRLVNLAGVVELGAGLLVAVRPRYGAYVVAVWLWVIALGLLWIADFFDIALHDLALSAAALALARLSRKFDPAVR